MSVVMGEHNIPSADTYENMRRDVDGSLFEGKFRISTIQLLKIIERYKEIQKLIQKKLDLGDEDFAAYQSGDLEKSRELWEKIDELEIEICRYTDFYSRWYGVDVMYSKLIKEYEYEQAIELLSSYYTKKIYEGLYNER